MTPINSINNFKYQYTGFGDFVKSLTNVEHHKILIVSANQSEEQRLQYIIIQIWLVSILFFQKKYGSLFFLPHWLRSRKYDKMKRDKRKMNNEYINRYWNYWVNLLWQKELNYSDNWNEELNVNDSNLFYETEWGYVFHPRWFYKYLKSFKNCPQWRYIFPNNGWDD